MSALKPPMPGSADDKKRFSKRVGGELSDMAQAYMSGTQSPGTSLNGGNSKQRKIPASRGSAGRGSGKSKLNPALQNEHLSGKRGSSFVGSGLNFPQSPTPQYSTGGSAKQVLRRIMMESESQGVTEGLGGGGGEDVEEDYDE